MNLKIMRFSNKPLATAEALFLLGISVMHYQSFTKGEAA